VKNVKIKLLENGPMRLSVQSDEETIKDVLFDSKGRGITIKKNSIICRCGKSKQQPFCDGVHRMCGFSAKYNEDVYEGIKVSVIKGGALEIEKANKEKYSLCRCGASQNQPYCDNAHESLNKNKYTF
jgi:CDGSH-type Zn-finger protein